MQLSLTGKEWRLLAPDSDTALRTRLLHVRDIATPETFFQPENLTLTPPENLKGIEGVLSRLKIAKGERVMLYGDYDVDGITSTTILFQTLQALGYQVSVRLPHRLHHGYGLRKEVFDECRALDVNLLITSDCGITNFSEIEYGKNLGIETIIIDHHTCPPVLPPAVAIIDPKRGDETYPTRDLVAGGLAYLVSEALLVEHPELAALREYNLVLAAIATIADCAPLRGDNRTIVAQGLQILHTRPPRVLQLLAQGAGIDLRTITTEQIAFQLAPRLNATGRLDDPMIGFDCLRGKVEYCQTLERLNRERQTITQTSLSEASMMLEKNPAQKMIFLFQPHWHVGVIGLIAGRLAEETGLPTFILCQKPDGTLVGSARTPYSFHVVQALEENKNFLLHFGGHHEAAGFSLLPENLSKFENGLKKYTETHFKIESSAPMLELDTFLLAQELIPELWEMLDEFEPYGIGNEKPLFLLPRVQLQDLRTLGKEATHLRLQIAPSGHQSFSAVAWQLGNLLPELDLQAYYDLALTPRKNIWQGKTTLEFELKDIRQAQD